MKYRTLIERSRNSSKPHKNLPKIEIIIIKLPGVAAINIGKTGA